MKLFSRCVQNLTNRGGGRKGGRGPIGKMDENTSRTHRLGKGQNGLICTKPKHDPKQDPGQGKGVPRYGRETGKEEMPPSGRGEGAS